MGGYVAWAALALLSAVILLLALVAAWLGRLKNAVLAASLSVLLLALELDRCLKAGDCPSHPGERGSRGSSSPS